MKKKYFFVLLIIAPFLVYFGLTKIKGKHYEVQVLPKTENTSSFQTFSNFKNGDTTFLPTVSLVMFMNNIDPIEENILYNLYEKIYHQYSPHADFRILTITNSEENKNLIKSKLRQLDKEMNYNQWQVKVSDCDKMIEDIKILNKKDTIILDCHFDKIYLVDKDHNIRGAIDKEGDKQFEFDPSSLVDLGKNLDPAIKNLLIEYHLALKKNNVYKLKNNN